MYWSEMLAVTFACLVYFGVLRDSIIIGFIALILLIVEMLFINMQVIVIGLVEGFILIFFLIGLQIAIENTANQKQKRG